MNEVGNLPGDGVSVHAAKISVLTVAALGLYDLFAGPGVVLAGVLTAGPCLAAVSGRPRTVIAVGGYTFVLVMLLSWPDQLWWTRAQLFFLVAVLVVTAISAVTARRRARSEEFSARAMAALRAGQARMQAVVDSALDCVITIDQAGRVVEFNPAAERTFGYPRDSVIGQDLAELVIPPPLREGHRRGLRECLDTGAGPLLDRHVELTAQRNGGGQFPVEASIARVDAPGVPLFTAYLQDISERKNAETARLALEAQLHQSQRLESLGQLAGGVAHDFNNLLGVIINYAEFLIEATSHQPAVQADAQEVKAAAQRAARLTRQLLIFARRETVQPQLLDLNAVVCDVRRLLDRTIGEHVELVTELAADLPAVYADRGHLEQILVNLAVNARDAMPDGGLLTISTSVTDADADRDGLTPDLTGGRYVLLSVGDTGTGMSPAVAAKAFEPFFTTKGPGDGSGLGLATVYGIANDAGGAVHLYSEPDLGTTVRVYLPASDRAPVQQPADQSDPATQHGSGETVLLVEDDDTIRAVIQRILGRRGYRVIDVATGTAALAAAETQRCDLLLTDIVMPEMSGRELAERLRQRDPDLAVLFMSGYSQDVLGRRRTIDSDVPLLQKPFNQAELLVMIKQVMRREHPARTADPPATAPGHTVRSAAADAAGGRE
jgi:two-component system cell cycle sensor histidine kinase/response regulator CckA